MTQWEPINVITVNIINQKIQWTLLNEITLGQTITDPINQMILITEYVHFLYRVCKLGLD
jgi:hypothetical protein